MKILFKIMKMLIKIMKMFNGAGLAANQIYYNYNTNRNSNKGAIYKYFFPRDIVA